MKHLNKQSSSKRKVWLVGGLVAALLIGGVVFKLTRSTKPTAPGSDAQTSLQNEDQPNPNRDADRIKEKIIEDEKKMLNTPPIAVANSVTPLITFADQVDNNIEIIAFVPGISEEGGNCTATITHDGQTITRTVAASKNASTTDCQAFVIPRSEFHAPGVWIIQVSYASTSALGNSAGWSLTLK